MDIVLMMEWCICLEIQVGVCSCIINVGGELCIKV
jgi:hypothetical protein